MTARRRQTEPQDLLCKNAAKLLLELLQPIRSFQRLAKYRRDYAAIINLLSQPQRSEVWQAFKEKETRIRGYKRSKADDLKSFKENLQQTANLINARNHNG